jgi:hypothetical protein
MFRLVAPAAIVVLAAAIGTTGSVVLGIDTVVVKGAVFGIVDDAVFFFFFGFNYCVPQGTEPHVALL